MTSDCADKVTLSRKEAKSRTHAPGLRSTRTKARTHVDRVRELRAELKKELEARTRELREAREEQAATAEVLQVISSSPGKLEPVFETMLGASVRFRAVTDHPSRQLPRLGCARSGPSSPYGEQIAGVGSGAPDHPAMSDCGQEETRDALPARPGFAFGG